MVAGWASYDPPFIQFFLLFSEQLSKCMNVLQDCPEIIRLKCSFFMPDGAFTDGPVFMDQDIAGFEEIEAAFPEVVDGAFKGGTV